MTQSNASSCAGNITGTDASVTFGPQLELRPRAQHPSAVCAAVWQVLSLCAYCSLACDDRVLHGVWGGAHSRQRRSIASPTVCTERYRCKRVAEIPTVLFCRLILMQFFVHYLSHRAASGVGFKGLKLCSD
uniref:Uncharacterized protein n=1 Tax=Ascaris lumbricoides TaxID=6252 RepID=A0A0M3HZ69_ASCLU